MNNKQRLEEYTKTMNLDQNKLGFRPFTYKETLAFALVAIVSIFVLAPMIALTGLSSEWSIFISVTVFSGIGLTFVRNFIGSKVGFDNKFIKITIAHMVVLGVITFMTVLM